MRQLIAPGPELRGRPWVVLTVMKTLPRRAVRPRSASGARHDPPSPGEARHSRQPAAWPGRDRARTGPAAPRCPAAALPRPGPRRRPSPVGAEQRLVDQHDEEGARPVEEG